MSNYEQEDDERLTTVLPQNLSFLGPDAKGRRLATDKRSWLVRAAWYLLGPVVTLALWSSVMSLVVGAVLWWVTPSWVFTSIRWLPSLTGVIDSDPLIDTTRNAFENLEALAEQAANEAPRQAESENLSPP